MSEPAKPKVQRNSVSWKSRYEQANAELEIANQKLADASAHIDSLRRQVLEAQSLMANVERDAHRCGFVRGVLAMADDPADPDAPPAAVDYGGLIASGKMGLNEARELHDGE